ncbi:EAL domain-containing protein [Sporosarcina sp. Te-1]|uniref:bifunctional diguanylate cyclase/phosphodiesterase n=1 Tax=Sporosarcina sp. Te-1 TaxID=2818390 RepID=UPI001A9EC630|nr:EAL domain-containing protein [Sporosarcina sp. Te-1]QTD39923.1 EAL domain-containing protein [Sporosarcina sp. Te-1]
MDHSIASMSEHQHIPYLVVLSYLIATMSAYASIVLARRVTFTRQSAKRIWLILGAGTLGIGIWSMHFIAMLSYQFPVPVYYNNLLVATSVVIAIVGCYFGYFIISVNNKNKVRFFLSGLIMGIGIASMHYVGMAALEAVTIEYNPLLFSISLLIAITASWVAIWIGFLSPYARRHMAWKLKIVFSMIMAVAITGMHYSGMAAATFSSMSASDSFKDGMDSTRLAWFVASVTVLIFALFFCSIVIDRLWQKRELVQNTLLDSIADGIVITDQTGTILHANPSFRQLMGEVTSSQRFDKLQYYHPELTEQITSELDFHVAIQSLILEVKRRPIQEEALHHSLWFLRDITEQIKNEKQITYMAYHDSLTRLPNRHKLDATLANWFDAKKTIGCIFINVDRMKFANDTLGHQAGDQLLRQIAGRLEENIQDKGFLARVGGDEFVILLADGYVKESFRLAEACVSAMNEPLSIHGTQLAISISAGTCIYPKDAANPNELLQFADLAMSESKRNGKNQVTAFTAKLNDQYRRKLQIEEALSLAIDQAELHLLYQPKVSVRSGKVKGVEALLRWIHPQHGFISPVEFIPIAEEKGLIHKIGDWVLKEACLQWVKWKNEMEEPPIIAVNISPLQLSREDFLPGLLKILQETKMDPRFLELELTESASLGFAEKTNGWLSHLHELGIQISLDDFGTGYSSFSHLKELPIDVLKIDRSFLRNLINNPGQEAIVRSIIQLGHNLNLQVLMEGVEEKVQVEWLEKEGCDLIQGYYFAKPQLPADLEPMLKDNGL